MQKNSIAYIICESIDTPSKAEIITRNDSAIKLKVTLQDGDLKNRNSRVYPKSVIQNGLNAPYIQERIRTKTWYGM